MQYWRHTYSKKWSIIENSNLADCLYFHLLNLATLNTNLLLPFKGGLQSSQIEIKNFKGIVVVQSLSHVQLFAMHELHQARPPWPLQSPGVSLSSCPLSCHSLSHPLPPSSYFAFNLSQHHLGSSSKGLCVLVTQSCRTLCGPMDCSPSMAFSRQEYWSGLSFAPSGDVPDPGIETWFSALQADSLPSESPGKFQRG